MTARALWVTGPGQAEIRSEPLGDVGPEDVRVRALFSGVSRGTEGLVMTGRVPAAIRDSMRAPFQQGDFPWPVKYGYCSVGVVEAGALPVGSRVFCLYPHQDHYVVPASAVAVLPDGVPSERAVLSANMETALNGVWDAGVGPGDRVTVIGAGVVGALTAWLVSRIQGTEVQLIDLVPERSALAEALGVAFAGPDGALPDRDCVFDASGTESGLRTALELAGDEATVVALSWYGDGQVSIPLGEAFHSRRLQLISSQVGRIPATRRARFDPRRRLSTALGLLEPVHDVLIDSEGNLDTLPADLARLAQASGRVLCHRVRYGG